MNMVPDSSQPPNSQLSSSVGDAVQKSRPESPQSPANPQPAPTGSVGAWGMGLRIFGLRQEIPRWISLATAAICVIVCGGIWWYVPGIPLGVAAGCFPIIRSLLSPLILFGRNIPVAALTALVFALFGTGELQKVMFIFIACVAFIVSDSVTAVQDVGQRYVETALTLGASRMQILFKVLVPLAMPSIFNSLRVMFGLAFGYIMLVEIVQEGEGAGGLGYMLNIARRRSRPEIMVIIVLAIPMFAWFIDQILYVIQCVLFRWKYSQEADQSVTVQVASRIGRLFWKPRTTEGRS
jgi:ABC-type nitrate/sulfonate/bicarbonate transport system permease component